MNRPIDNILIKQYAKRLNQMNYDGTITADILVPEIVFVRLFRLPYYLGTKRHTYYPTPASYRRLLRALLARAADTETKG